MVLVLKAGWGHEKHLKFAWHCETRRGVEGAASAAVKTQDGRGHGEFEA